MKRNYNACNFGEQVFFLNELCLMNLLLYFSRVVNKSSAV